MNEPAGLFKWFTTQGKLAGSSRLLLGFIIGALFALLPMYYFYMGRETALRAANDAQPQPLASVEAPRRGTEPTRADSSRMKPFASRMTYELSQLPEELPPPQAKAPAAQVASARTQRVPEAAPAPAPPLEDAVATERVVNARPISAVPPDPRDTTREMEREARRSEYREPPAKKANAASAPGPAPISGRVIEGRDIELKTVKPVPPPAAAAQKKPLDVRAVIAAAPQVEGVTAIKPPESNPAPADAPPRFAVVTPTAPASSAAGEPVTESVAERLAATRDWLSAAPQTTLTIQLMGTNSEEQLRNHLKLLTKSLEPSKIYVFRTLAQGKPSMTVVYGAYADRQSAQQALEKLPPAITANKPVLRTVNGIRTEMKQNKTDS